MQFLMFFAFFTATIKILNECHKNKKTDNLENTQAVAKQIL